MLVIVAVRLVWLGNGLQVTCGLVLLAAFAMCLAGFVPYMTAMPGFVLQAPLAGGIGLVHYRRFAAQRNAGATSSAWLAIVLPVVAVLGFSTLFVLANPDIATAVFEWLRWFSEIALERIRQFAPSAPEVLFWIAVACTSIGLLRPILRAPVDSEHSETVTESPDEASTLFSALRNTLLAVIALFAAYLVFEFKTLWFRVFPEGFHYSGYAHEGAAWLTAALALATIVLSLIFRPQVMRDPRISELRRLAWIWSIENLLLALAVYHRLYIYIGFNGMTRMRTVGLLGITAVVVGFVLVVRKITRGHDFVWLVRRQLWTVAVAVYLFAVIPVDPLVHTYNVRRILDGDPAPSVQISVHPIDSAGVLVLFPLLESDNAIIREGVRALLADRAVRLDAVTSEQRQSGWTSYQIANRVLYDELQRSRSDWVAYADATAREAARERFDEYAYQWY